MRIFLAYSFLLLTINLQSQEAEINLHQYDSLSGDELWQLILEENKGKVIYGEISGTWCMPCMMELPFLDSLHKNYEGKEVEFIIFWANSNERIWNEAKLKYNLRGTHLFMTEEQRQPIMNKINAYKYPTYFLLDLEGNIYKEDAPRPSSEYSYKHIDLLLSME